MRWYQRRRPAGFSLTEVMVALAIFSIGSLALIPLFHSAAWGARGGRDLTRATAIARAYVDQLRNAPFASVVPCSPAPCELPSAEAARVAPAEVTWEVTQADGTAYDVTSPPVPDLKRVTVTVSIPCPDCREGQRVVRMTTLIADRS